MVQAVERRKQRRHRADQRGHSPPYTGISIQSMVGPRRARLSLATVDDVQVGARQRRIRTGEKGTPVIFAEELTFNEGDEDERKIFMHRSSSVFYVAQIEKLPKEVSQNRRSLNDRRSHLNVGLFVAI